MAQVTSITLTQSLTSLLFRPKVEQEAQRLGVVVRRRTVDIYALVWTLVPGLQEDPSRFIATLQWAYEKVAPQHLSRSSLRGAASLVRPPPQGSQQRHGRRAAHRRPDHLPRRPAAITPHAAGDTEIKITLEQYRG